MMRSRLEIKTLPFPVRAGTKRPEHGIVLRGIHRMIQALATDPRDPWPHTTLNDYCRGEELGSGSFGVVWSGYVLDDQQKQCAIKQCAVAEEIVRILNGKFDPKREMRELKVTVEDTFCEIYVLNRLRHVNILHSHAVFLEEGNLEIVMPKLLPLYTVMKRYRIATEEPNRPLPKNVCANVSRQLLEGLEFMHTFKIIHRDLKSDNVLISPGGVVKICDFGLAQFLERDRCSGVAGTEEFMDYDVYSALTSKGKKSIYSYPADIWSVGVVILEMVLNFPKCIAHRGAKHLATMMKTNETDFKWTLNSEFPDIFGAMEKYDPNLFDLLNAKVLTTHTEDRLIAGELFKKGFIGRFSHPNIDLSSECISRFVTRALQCEELPSTTPNVERLESIDLPAHLSLEEARSRRFKVSVLFRHEKSNFAQKPHDPSIDAVWKLAKPEDFRHPKNAWKKIVKSGMQKVFEARFSCRKAHAVDLLSNSIALLAHHYLNKGQLLHMDIPVFENHVKQTALAALDFANLEVQNFAVSLCKLSDWIGIEDRYVFIKAEVVDK